MVRCEALFDLGTTGGASAAIQGGADSGVVETETPSAESVPSADMAKVSEIVTGMNSLYLIPVYAILMASF
jgi:hypothetical protein